MDLGICYPHIMKDFTQRCDSKNGNYTHSINCKLGESRKHTFHSDAVCYLYTHSFPESAFESILYKGNQGKFLLRKQKKEF